MWEYVTDRILSVSAITFEDEALIRATMELNQNPVFQCNSKVDTLLKRYSLDPDADRKIDHLMKAHSTRSGCDRYEENPLHTVGRFNYHSCLCNFNHPLIHYFFTITDLYEKGTLPHSGSISDQSARLVDIIQLIQMLRQEYTNKMQEKLHKEANVKR